MRGVADAHRVRSRSFSPWSHVVSMVYAHLSHAMSLNDVCDAMQTHEGKVSTIRGAVAPRRNTFSYANRTRDPAMAEALFWQTLGHLNARHPTFGKGRGRRLLPRRFNRTISILASSTLAIVGNSMVLAKIRRRYAA